MSTVHIVQRMALGGIETLVLDLVRHGAGANLILSLEGDADELVDAWPALRAERRNLIGFDRKPGLRPLLVTQLAAKLTQLRPHTVVAHHIGPLFYGGPAVRIAGVPRLVHVEHDIWHYQQNRRRRWITKCWSYLFRPVHVAVSHKAAAAMRGWLPSASITVIPPGIDTDRFKPGKKAAARARLGLDPGRPLIGTAGRLVPIKGHKILIDAMRELPERVEVAIAGDGPELKQLQSFARELGVAARLHFLGHRDDLERVLGAFDVFCLPSLAEGLPRSVLEAQACGVPVVASDVGALDEAVCPRAGCLVPPSDPKALARGLRLVLAHGTVDESPRVFVETYYSLSRTLEAYRILSRGPLS
jgi:glycosyltransferase involved in cell wall biosynthesis